MMNQSAASTPFFALTAAPVLVASWEIARLWSRRVSAENRSAELDITDADVALAGPYQGRRRMTLTFPIINRSRLVLWLVTGREKAADDACCQGECARHGG